MSSLCIVIERISDKLNSVLFRCAIISANKHNKCLYIIENSPDLAKQVETNKLARVKALVKYKCL